MYCLLSCSYAGDLQEPEIKALKERGVINHRSTAFCYDS